MDPRSNSVAKSCILRAVIGRATLPPVLGVATLFAGHWGAIEKPGALWEHASLTIHGQAVCPRQAITYRREFHEGSESIS